MLLHQRLVHPADPRGGGIHRYANAHNQGAEEKKWSEASARTSLENVLHHGARLTSAAHNIWSQFVKDGETVVDATAGNGHDTVELARLVGVDGCVHAFDIQEKAIESTSQALERAFMNTKSRPSIELHRCSFTSMEKLVGKNTARVIAFNLGYLPGSDKSITTDSDVTCEGIKQALEVLVPGGLLSILSYTGHPGGLEEYAAVKELVAGLPPASWVSSEIRLLNRPSAPVLMLVWKK